MTEVLFIQEVSGAYNSLLLDTDETKMASLFFDINEPKLALWARKVSGTFQKRVPNSESHHEFVIAWNCKCCRFIVGI